MKTQTSCGHRECTSGKSDSWLTWPNLVTIVRTVAALVLTIIAIWKHNETLLFIGLGVYWVGDIADGALARLIGQETRNGGLFDILSDRLCVAAFYMTYVQFHHDMLLPIAIFLFNFMLVDNMLSVAYLRWPVMSPNYFYLVDKQVYKLNWSPVAKSLNTGLLIIVIVVVGQPWLATLLATAQLALKFYSTRLLTKVPVSVENPLNGCLQQSS